MSDSKLVMITTKLTMLTELNPFPRRRDFDYSLSDLQKIDSTPDERIDWVIEKLSGEYNEFTGITDQLTQMFGLAYTSDRVNIDGKEVRVPKRFELQARVLSSPSLYLPHTSRSNGNQTMTIEYIRPLGFHSLTPIGTHGSKSDYQARMRQSIEQAKGLFYSSLNDIASLSSSNNHEFYTIIPLVYVNLGDISLNLMGVSGNKVQ